MPLDASFAQLPNQTVEVTLNGSMTLGTSLKVLESQLKSSLNDGATHLILNLTAVNYMDSAGLGLIVFTNAELTSKNGSLLLRGVNQRLHNLFERTRTDAILKFDA